MKQHRPVPRRAAIASITISTMLSAGLAVVYRGPTAAAAFHALGPRVAPSATRWGRSAINRSTTTGAAALTPRRGNAVGGNIGRRRLPRRGRRYLCDVRLRSLASSTEIAVDADGGVEQEVVDVGPDDYYDVMDDYSDSPIILEDESASDENTVSDSTPQALVPEAQESNERSREDLQKELKQYRIDQSASSNKPAYAVFTNAALEEICNRLPSSEGDLLDVKGIGPKKLESYGEDILNIVRRHAGEGLLPNGAGFMEGGNAPIPRPDPITIESLTEEQRRAAEIALSDEAPSNVFISGPAGTGKSHVLKFVIQTLKERKSRFAVCAPTGVAAINVGGSTLHSFFGIGLGTGSVAGLVRKVRKKKEVRKRIDETDTLLIDEVSMLSSDLMETLDAVIREVRQDGLRMNEPFGGMNVVAVGDFFQLPPIIQGHTNTWDRDMMRPFCFDSPVWDELGLARNTIELKQVQRQKSGSKFEIFLNMVRTGDVTEDIIRDLNSKCLIGARNPLPDDGIVPTRLYTHNRGVDLENEARLDELDGEMVVCKAKDVWREAMPTGTPAAAKKNMKMAVAGMMPDEVKIKVGAQVMLTRNLSLDKGLVNGSRGIIERFESGSPVVRFDNGVVEKIVDAEAERYNADGGPGCLVRKQVPLRLAWAVTVHKCQGSTLTRAILDISSTFEPGQAYVSLSRVKSINGLWLEKPVRMDNIMVSPRVLNYYRGQK